MFASLLLEIVNQKWAVVANIAAVLLFCGFYWFKTRQYSWTPSKMKYFSYLYSFRKRELVSIGIVMGRLIFIITSALFCTDIHLGYLIVFILMNVTIFVSSRNVKVFLFDCLNYVLAFFLLYIEKLLIDFYFDVESSPVIIVMIVFLVLFIILYAVLQAINSYDHVVVWEPEND